MKNFYRWVVLILLFLNLGYCAWSIATLEDAQELKKPEIDAQASKLELFNESGEAGASASNYSEHLEGAASGQKQTNPKFSNQPNRHAEQFYPSQPFCPSFGPFEDRAQAERFVAIAGIPSTHSELRPVFSERFERFRVYIPAPLSTELALQELAKLRIKKVDSFIITEGAMRNAISLGVFTSKESAEGLASKLRSENFQAKVQSFYDQNTEFWLQTSLIDEFEDLEKSILSAMIEHNGIARVDSPCKAIALSE